jgi:hypothetical protein
MVASRRAELFRAIPCITAGKNSSLVTDALQYKFRAIQEFFDTFLTTLVTRSPVT